MRLSSNGPIALAAAAALALAIGCDPFVPGNGVYATQYRVKPEFQGVRVEDGVQLVATAGVALAPVKVIGDANLLEKIRTDVEPLLVGTTEIQVLHVQVDGQIDPVIAPQVVVSVPSFKYVEASDTSAVTVTGSGGDALAVKLRGGALLDATGYATAGADVDLEGNAIAKLRASGPVTGSVLDHATLENFGPCTVTTSVNATVRCDE